jgi:hypothetical protein
MKARILILLVCTLGSTACSTVSPELGVRTRLRDLAGAQAIDCGRAASPVEVPGKSECATEALEQKVPFFVQYQSTGTDAITEEGLALDGHGKLSYVWTISWSPLYRGKPSGKFSVNTCAGPPRKLSDAKLTCDFPLD